MASLFRSKRPAPTPHSQSQSPLFAKLPPELREAIFRLVVVASPPKLTLRACDSPLKLDLVTHGVGGPQILTFRAARVLSLLRSCRRAHDEGLPLLYGANTFCVGQRDAVRLLAASVGAQWLRRLDFGWSLADPRDVLMFRRRPETTMVRAGRSWWWRRRHGFDYDDRDFVADGMSGAWGPAWAALRQLPSLRWLKVVLSVPVVWQERWREREEQLLEPLVGLLPEGAWGQLTLSWERVSDRGAEDMLPEWEIRRGYLERDVVRIGIGVELTAAIRSQVLAVLPSVAAETAYAIFFPSDRIKAGDRGTFNHQFLYDNLQALQCSIYWKDGCELANGWTEIFAANPLNKKKPSSTECQ
ncbi:hypothetical protein PG991_006352 [Apiospora marii]|uniref:DUF7730 domain-containing protein n=1 Tax=Apiospora marii TaxID=335849 RepID=A0ABR1SC32_9PEZI